MARKTSITVGPEGARRKIEVKLSSSEPEPWDADARLAVIGTSVPRVDGSEKTTGAARYTHDIVRPGMLHAVVLRCPFPAARAKSVDATGAKALPGVRVVRVLAETVFRYEGEEVAAVAAETIEIAREAVSRIRIEWEKRPFVTDATAARDPGSPRVFDGPNAREPRVRDTGDARKALAKAPVRVESEFRTRVQTHVSLETHGVVAEWQGKKLTVWASTQGTFAVREGLAESLGIPLEDVTVRCEFMGGGFGSKFGPGSFAILAAELAREAGRPVRLVLNRREEHLCTGNRPDAVMRLSAGASKDGKLSAMHLVSYGTPGVGSGAGVSGPIRAIYDCPNVRCEEQDVWTNTGPAAPMRAPGHPQGSFALEQVMDMLAAKLSLDPVEFRLTNDSHPVRRLQYVEGARRIGWKRRSADGASKGTLRRGFGVASGVWYNTGGPGASVEVIVSRDGSVEVRNGAQDIGTGTKTFLAMIVAEELGLAASAVRVTIGDTALPWGPASGGSSTTPSLAPAARTAGFAAREKLAALVAKKLSVPGSRLAFADGRVSAPGGRSISFRDACRAMSGDSIRVVGDRASDHAGYEAKIAGVQFAEVEVDVETGRIRPVKIVAIQDCGRVINPMLVESQIHGGVVQGVSYALFEERILDGATGRMLNADLESYKIAGALDLPEIEAIPMSVPAGFNNLGALGVGEPPVIPTAAALANAFANATGVRLFELPMTPRAVLAALGSAP